MLKMYRCKHCGNIVIMAYNGGGQLVCCGEPMELLEANTFDAAAEKHVPVATVDGNTVTVKVGSVEHPMTEEHYIQFIILETSDGYQKKDLAPGDAPCAEFVLADGQKPVCAYAYCNLHGLWKADI